MTMRCCPVCGALFVYSGRLGLLNPRCSDHPDETLLDLKV